MLCSARRGNVTYATHRISMNKAAAFDIRRYIRHLTESGFTEQQAEEQAGSR